MLKAGASLVIVLFLMIGLTALFKYFTNQKHTSFNPMKKKRLNVVDMKAIDHRHKLVLVERDNIQHLVLLSGTNAPLLIEQGITPPLVDETDDKLDLSDNDKDKNILGSFGSILNPKNKKAWTSS